MLERQWTILCKRVEELPNHELTLHNIFQVAYSKTLPVISDRFFIVSSFIGEIGEEFKIIHRFLDPSGKPYGPYDTLDMAIRRKPEPVIFGFDNVYFLEFGRYGIEIELDGTPIYVMPIEIIKID